MAKRAWRLQLPACPRQGLADFRVAVLPTHALAEADSEVGDQIEGPGRWLEAQGAQVAWHRRPDFDADELWHTYVTMLRATTSVHMDEAGFGAVLARPPGSIRSGATTPHCRYGAGIRHRDWLQLQQKRAAFAASWQRFSPSSTSCSALPRSPPPSHRRAASPGNARSRSTAARCR